MTNELLKKHYDSILSSLRSGGRPSLKLDDEIIQAIVVEFETASDDQFLPLFCLLDFASRPVKEFEKSLLDSASRLKSDDSIIAWLGVCQKHIIERQSRDGDPIPSQFINQLKQLLTDKKNQSWEVLEWVLRTVVMMGARGIELKSEVEAIRPKVFSLFNSHQRQYFEILDSLQKEWNLRRRN